MSARLTKPQRVLLAEIKAAGVLYIRPNSPYYRTVTALERRGLVYVKEPDYSRLRMDGWSPTEEQSNE